MLKRWFCIVILIVLCLNIVFPVLSIAKEEESKVLCIKDETDLYNFAERVNNGENFSGYIVELTEDIELNCSEQKQWIPIGTYKTPFEGIFNGNNKAIKGMKIYEQSEYTGFFGYVYLGEISNLTIENSEIVTTANEDKDNCFGIIAGVLATATVRRCKTKNCKISITTEKKDCKVGGIIGLGADGKYRYNTISNFRDCNIENVSNDTKIIIDKLKSTCDDVGGIIGCSYGVDIKCCNNTAEIQVNSYNCATGGIAGCNAGTIKKCYNTGNIITIGESNMSATGTGGIVGSNHSTIENTYNTGNIKGASFIGGITGTNATSTNNVLNSYNTGTISGEDYVGGISGRNGSTNMTNGYGAEIVNCYNTGNIESNRNVVGNIVGHNNPQGILKNCYYVKNDLPAYGKNISEENNTIYEKSETEFKQNGFETQLNGNTNSYKFDQYNNNKGYPILVWNSEIEMEEYPEKLFYEINKDSIQITGGKLRVKNNYSNYDYIIDLKDENVNINWYKKNIIDLKTLEVLYNKELITTFDIESIDNYPIIMICYSIIEPTINNVTVTINSNKEIQEIEGWNLSEDKKVLTKEFQQNALEEVIIKDYFEKKIKVSVEIKNIDKIAPIITGVENGKNYKDSVKITATDENLKTMLLEKDQLYVKEYISGKEIIEEGKYKFTAIDKTGNTAEVNFTIKYIRGELNEDNKIDNGDTLMLLRYLAYNSSKKVAEKYQYWNFNEKKKIIGDVNRDGKIDTGDVLTLQRYQAAKSSKKIEEKHPSWLNIN